MQEPPCGRQASHNQASMVRPAGGSRPLIGFNRRFPASCWPLCASILFGPLCPQTFPGEYDSRVARVYQMTGLREGVSC